MKTLSIAIILLLLLLTQSVSSFAKIPPKARQILYKAQLLMDNERFKEAADVIKKYMNSTSETIDAQVYLTLGGCLNQAGDEKNAYSVFKQGFQKYPEDEILCRNTAVAAYELEKFDESGKLLEKAYTLQKKPDPKILFQSGSMYYQGEDFKNSARVMLKLISSVKNPEKEWILLTIHSLLADRQIAKTKSILLKYLASTPEDAAYWQLLAKLNMEKDQMSEAAAALEIAYRLKQPSQSELLNLAAIYRYEEAPLLAAKVLQRAYGKNINSKQALKISALYASAGRITEAIKYLDLYTVNGTTLLKKGKLLFTARKFKQAENTFKKCLGSKEANEARFYLALCAWEQKEWSRARKELLKITDITIKKRSSGYLDILREIEKIQL
ncbi:tetratricopeptide repeat protein [Maridesulfovibrio bastinii]|uniref:tetratricopeptide repeat protein n=1 Tax=Maridesulfovibrio bastinii TaxID=47157 RepID=UPI00041FD4C7|nr:tetratricopeptide repeat protein [Maridesulfovibrio bastinii]